MSGIKSILPYHKPLAEEVRSNIFWCDGFMTIPNSSPRTEFFISCPSRFILPSYRTDARCYRVMSLHSFSMSCCDNTGVRVSKYAEEYYSDSPSAFVPQSRRKIQGAFHRRLLQLQRAQPQLHHYWHRECAIQSTATCFSEPTTNVQIRLLITQRLRGPHSHCSSWTCHISAKAEGESDADTV